MTAIDRLLGLIGLGEAPAIWPPREMSLALQGGGSFGAFTWGALDRLLEAPGLRFDAISGASAGAVNAALLASGLSEGGNEGARARLASFWRRMSGAAGFASPASLGFDLGAIVRSFSPYQLNPFNLNPLREALAAEIDFARLRAQGRVKLLVAATRVRDGQLRIFRNSELTVDTLLASACLPLIHHAIEIDGEAYWDGGYVANPPLIPLVRETRAAQLLIVQATPARSERVPTTPREILKRLDQIQFNSSLNSELEALKLGKLLQATPKLRRLRIGRVSAQEEFEGLEDASAADLRWSFLERLRDAGRSAVALWLDQAARGGASARAA